MKLSTYQKNKLKKLTLEEIENIKQKATKEEIENLEFIYLDPSSSYSCIYGQMTGECYSPRAKELQPKIFDNLSLNSIGTQKDLMIKGNSFTALERWIYIYPENNKNIIDYIKGKTNTLKL